MTDLAIHPDGRMTWTLPIRPSDSAALVCSDEWRAACRAFESRMLESAFGRWADSTGPDSVLDRILEDA